MKDIAQKKLLKIIQRLKSLILQDLDTTTREQLKAALLQLDKDYTNKIISLEEYKQKSLTLLCSYRDLCWSEQFLYRETGNFLTQSEKFLICESIRNLTKK